MSEVITRTRQYMMELVGGQGNVMTHHKTIKDLEQYYSSMGDNKDVKEFLKNITSDKEGYANRLFLGAFTHHVTHTPNIFVSPAFCIYSRGLVLLTTMLN